MRFWAVALVIGVAMAPAMAQQSAQPGVTQRVDRLEREMRAVQRKVFPGSGNQQYFEPEIAPAETPAAGIPASSPINDLTARVGALEAELSRLTGQIEQNSFKIRQLEDAATRQKTEIDTRLRALEGGTPPVPAGSAGTSAPVVAPPAAAPRPSAGSASATPAPPATPPAATPPTGDAAEAAEDAYLAGYRLWEAHQYDQAATALRAVVERYPNHRRASYAQNLLGRSLLDNGQPARAAEVFYSNYQRMPRGERAPDSLYFLGQSLMAIRPPKPQDACKVYGELLDVYGSTINAALRTKVTEGQRAARCAAN